MANVLIISSTSGIGNELAKRYREAGDTVIGTYRNEGENNCDHLFRCDIDDLSSVKAFIRAYDGLEMRWDTVIMCPANPLPIEDFFSCDFEVWKASVDTNFINQLRVIHSLYPYRSKQHRSNIIVFAGGGVNNAVIDFSAYTISKIALIKMCELIDAENEDINIVAIGPGKTKTKIMDTILANSEGSRYEATKKFISCEDGTSMDDIYECIRWVCSCDKVASGRNFSVEHDPWGTFELYEALDNDENIYKLRRCGNETGRSV